MHPEIKYYVDNIFPNLSGEYILLTGLSALAYNGLDNSGIYIPDVVTIYPELDEILLGNLVRYWYYGVKDVTNYVKPLPSYPRVLVPTVERAIVENIKYDFKAVDLGYFLDEVDRYVGYGEHDMDKIMEVADFYKVPRDKVIYWINEALDYNTY